MSKGNLLLGYGRGALGDIVLSHYAGEQVARARNRRPSNPRTVRQMIQRVIMKTTTTAYSLFRPIADHSFEGFAKGTECQSRFTQLNVADMRRKFNDVWNSGFGGDPYDPALVNSRFNYSKKQDTMAEINNYIISQGTIHSMNAEIYGTAANNIVAVLPFVQPCGQEIIASDVDYAAVVQGLRLQQGDQLTFVFAACDDSVDIAQQEMQTFPACKFINLKYYRIILEPEDQSMDSTFIDEATIVNDYGKVDTPNPRNRDEGLQVGLVPISEKFPYGGIGFFSEEQNMAAGTDNTTMAVAVIASRLGANGKWQRSTERIKPRPDKRLAPNSVLATRQVHTTDYMGYAINSFMTESGSSLYLNQSV